MQASLEYTSFYFLLLTRLGLDMLLQGLGTHQKGLLWQVPEPIALLGQALSSQSLPLACTQGSRIRDITSPLPAHTHPTDLN
jgi:hypothetical protein